MSQRKCSTCGQPLGEGRITIHDAAQGSAAYHVDCYLKAATLSSTAAPR